MKKRARLSVLVVLALLLICFGAMPPMRAQAAQADLELQYDDRKDLAVLLEKEVTQVVISDEQVTSCQVGTEAPDTHVLIYEDGVLYAVGTGTATLTVDGVVYSVNVSPAELSLFMYTGHSVGHGVRGTATQSVVIEAGQAYSSYDPHSLDVTQVDGYGLGYGSAKRVGDTDAYAVGQGSAHIDAFSAEYDGTRGAGSGLAYQWNQLTGGKAWIINLAVGGSCLNEWQPGAEGHSTDYSDYYYTAVSRYSYAQTIISNEIAAGHYTLGHMGILYYCGANHKNYPDWSQEGIEKGYEVLWSSFKSAFTRDMDGDGDTETVEFFGLVPYFTPTNLTSMGFDKPAAFYMSSSESYPDIIMASDAYRNWMTEEGLASFPQITYTTQSKAVSVPEAVSYSEDTPNSVMSDDGSHPNQVVYNAMGIDTANNIYAWVTGQDDTVTTFDLILSDLTSVSQRVTICTGEPYVMLPMAKPCYTDDLTYEVTGNAVLEYPLAVVGTQPGTAILTVKQGNTVLRTVEFTVVQGHDTHCVCGGTLTGTAAEHHTCDQGNTWVPFTTDISRYYAYARSETESRVFYTVVLGGNYYLTDDMTWSGSISVAPGQTFNLCLNGHTLTTTGRSFRINGSVNICDCHGGGQVISQHTDSAPVAYLYSGGLMNIYGGTFSSVEPGNREYGGCIGVATDRLMVDYTEAKQASQLNIYGGKLIGSDLYSTDGSVTGGGQGGAVTVINGACGFNLYGGTLQGGNTVSGNSGGGVIATVGTTKLYGGTIAGSRDALGAVYVGSDKVSLLGTVSFTDNDNADLYVASGKRLNIGVAQTGQVRLNGADANTVIAQISEPSQAENLVSAHATATEILVDNSMVYLTEPADQAHKHCVCGGLGDLGDHTCADLLTWTAWDGKATSGNYYLTGDINLTKTVVIAKETTLNLCLNGYDIIGGTGVTRMFNIYGTLNLCDHKQSDGSYKGDITSNYNTTGGNVQAGRVFYIQNSSANGSGMFNMYGGNLRSNSSTKNAGIGGICHIMNMYDGTISGGTATGNGGNLRIEAATAVLTMYGGTVSGGSAATGGNIQSSQNKAKVYLYGGQILEGDICTAGDLVMGNMVCDTIRCITQGMKIQLTGDCTAELSVEADVYLNLNGNTLTGNAAGTATLYAYDSATDDYDSSDMGCITGTVSCGLPHNFQGTEDTIGSVNRYLTVAGESGYSFHRFYLGLVKISLKTQSAGLGYKAVFAGSQQVQAQLETYGYNLWIYENMVVTRSNGPEKFVSLNDVTLGLNNVLSQSYSTQQNLDNAELAIHATVYMTLNGQTITSAQQDVTLRETVTKVNDNYEGYSPAQQIAIHNMLVKYADVVQAWGLTLSHHNQEGITAWNGTATHGTYFLGEDMQIDPLIIGKGEALNICLNGHTLSSTGRVFDVYGQLNICDCKNTGVVSGAATINGSAVHVYSTGTMNLVGGTVTSSAAIDSSGVVCVEGTLNMDGGTLQGTQSTGNGANLYVKKGTVNLSGGAVTGGNAGTKGGNIYMNGIFNMTGGTVTGGQAADGGNMYMTGGSFTMTGGSFEGGTSTASGGSIYLYGGAFNMTGGTVTDGNAAVEGGNFRVGGSSKLNLSGNAMVENGIAAKTGGNVQLYGTMTLKDCAQVKNGTAGTYGGNMSVFANASTATASFTMTGGTISGGTANRASGIRLQSNEGTVNVTITGGSIGRGVANIQYPCVMLGGNHVNLTLGGTAQIAELSILEGYSFAISEEMPMTESADIVIDKVSDGVIGQNVTTDVSGCFRFTTADREITYNAADKTLVLTNVLQDKQAAYLASLSADIEPTGVTKADYAAIVAQCLAEYDRINPLTTVTVAGLEDQLQAYSRILSSMAVLVDYGANNDITGFASDYDTALFESFEDFKALFAAMMQTGCDAALDYAGRDNLNFAVKELVIAYNLARQYYDEATVAAWADPLQQIQPDTTFYTHAEKASNRNAYLMGGEQLRAYLGLGDQAAVADLIDTSLAIQLSHFDSNGMYRDEYGASDEHDPMLYDLTTRVQLQLVLGFGYDGEYADELDELLKSGGMMTLFTTSANGELPYGGRSNQYLFNAALISANCEYEASRYAAAGDMKTAGAFKRNAHIAIGSIADYLAANKHIMNYYADSTIGTESYGSYDKYMVTMSSFLSIAYLFADDTVQEAVTPAEVGGYVIETSGYFDAIVASVGNYSIQLLTSADDHYDSVGLGRIQKAGVYSALGLSTSLTSEPAYTVGGQVKAMTVSAAWTVDGIQYRLAEMNQLSHKLTVIQETAQCVEFVVTYTGSQLVGVRAVEEHYVLTDQELTVTTTLHGYEGAVLYSVPLLARNGDSELAGQTQITVSEIGFNVALAGQQYTVTSDAVSATVGETAYCNRNGEYYEGVLTGKDNSITVSMILE